MIGTDFNRVCLVLDEIEGFSLQASKLVSEGKLDDARRARSRIYGIALQSKSLLDEGKAFHRADELALEKYSKIFNGIIERGIDLDCQLDEMSNINRPMSRMSSPYFAELKRRIFRGDYAGASQTADRLYDALFRISGKVSQGDGLKVLLVDFMDELCDISRRIQFLITDDQKITREEP